MIPFVSTVWLFSYSQLFLQLSFPDVSDTDSAARHKSHDSLPISRVTFVFFYTTFSAT